MNHQMSTTEVPTNSSEGLPLALLLARPTTPLPRPQPQRSRRGVESFLRITPIASPLPLLLPHALPRAPPQPSLPLPTPPTTTPQYRPALSQSVGTTARDVERGLGAAVGGGGVGGTEVGVRARAGAGAGATGMHGSAPRMQGEYWRRGEEVPHILHGRGGGEAPSRESRVVGGVGPRRRPDVAFRSRRARQGDGVRRCRCLRTRLRLSSVDRSSPWEWDAPRRGADALAACAVPARKETRRRQGRVVSHGTTERDDVERVEVAQRRRRSCVMGRGLIEVEGRWGLSAAVASSWWPRSVRTSSGP
ncbi:hypothetical protein DFH09DRAFT_1299238 [Mycena vulgaris]|nr:hypothetical protein DFH09DRAFT_1299238 [Mycena vulgaris]